MQAKILLVDDEKDIVEFLQYNLEAENYTVLAAYDGEMALKKMEENPDLVVLDIAMPKLNGYEVCKKIREDESKKNIPIIFLTAKITELDELKGFEVGADDYIKKPISPKMLVARIKSKLKRFETEKLLSVNNGHVIKVGPLQINLDKYEVLIDNEKIILPKKEFAVLAYLANKPGKVFPRERILNDVWGENIFVVERTIDVHVRKIREKLGKYSELIETIKGVGYRFKEI